MAKKSKLLAALDAEKGRDYTAEKKKKELKAGEKRKRQREEEAKQAELNKQNGDDDDDEDQDETPSSQTAKKAAPKKPNGILKPAKSASADEDPEDSEEDASEAEGEEETTASTTIPQPSEPIDASASEAEQESDVPLSDLDVSDLEDTIPHQRLTINNGPALLASTKRVTIITTTPQMPFHHHNSLISTLPAPSTTITDPNDDLTRELEFYRIAKEATITARSLFKKEKIPFSRPTDYFAEMVKSDEHMGKVKKKMYDEAAGKKASEEARKLRDAKKFGKQVQVAKEQERAREKRDTLDKIKELKRKRKGQTSETINEPDNLFQEISLEDGPSRDKSGRDRGGGAASSDGRRPNAKRQKRDSRFGFGGKKRFSKSGDAVSSADLSGFASAARMKGRAGGSGSGSRGRGGSRGGARGGARGGTTRRLGKSKRAPGRV